MNLFFRDRIKLTKIIFHWCKSNNISRDIFNIITFLSDYELLNNERVKEFMMQYAKGVKHEEV